MPLDNSFTFPIDHNKRKVSECLGISDTREEKIKEGLQIAIFQERENGISGVIENLLQIFKEPNELTFALYMLGRWSAQSECPLHNKDYSQFAKMLEESFGEDGPEVQIIKL